MGPVIEVLQYARFPGVDDLNEGMKAPFQKRRHFHFRPSAALPKRGLTSDRVRTEDSGP
jgi:hypothetical protein